MVAWELSFMEGGCLDELDIRELLKHDQPFRDIMGRSRQRRRIAVQQYRFRGGKQGEELVTKPLRPDARMIAHPSDETDTFVERDDVDWLDDFELTKDDLADGK